MGRAAGCPTNARWPCCGPVKEPAGRGGGRSVHPGELAERPDAVRRGSHWAGLHQEGLHRATLRQSRSKQGALKQKPSAPEPNPAPDSPASAGEDRKALVQAGANRPRESVVAAGGQDDRALQAEPATRYAEPEHVAPRQAVGSACHGPAPGAAGESRAACFRLRSSRFPPEAPPPARVRPSARRPRARRQPPGEALGLHGPAAARLGERARDPLPPPAPGQPFRRRSGWRRKEGVRAIHHCNTGAVDRLCLRRSNWSG